MDEVDTMLSSLPEESPPPEIVLSAVRAFRYRAIAVVASLMAGFLILFVVLPSVGPDDLGVRAESLRTRGVTPLLVSAELETARVTLTELVMGDGEGYIHFIVEETGENSVVEVNFESVMISADGRFARSAVAEGQSLEVGAVDPALGECFVRGPDAASGWIRFEGDHDPDAPLTVVFSLFLVPPEAYETCGYETEGPPPTLRVEYPGEVSP